MCLDSQTSALLVGGLAGGIIGAPIAYGMDQARRQQKEMERAMKNQEAMQKSLMEEYKEANRPQASKLVSGLSTRDKQRMLARSMGGTLLTDPMGSGMPTYGKKTLLGE